MTADVEVEIVLQQRLELYAQQPALGQHTAPLLDEIPEILFQSRIRNHHSFSEEGSHLGAADVEYVAAVPNVL